MIVRADAYLRNNLSTLQGHASGDAVADDDAVLLLVAGWWSLG